MLRPHSETAREAFLAFYAGYHAAAIAALIPVVEGAITTMFQGAAGSRTMIATKVHKVLDGARDNAASVCFDNRWAPQEYQDPAFLRTIDSRVFIIDSLRRWLLDSFFCPTHEYKGQSGLNRHRFAHGLDTVWKRVRNFNRLLAVLEALTFVEGWRGKSRIRWFNFDETNEEANALWHKARRLMKTARRT